MIDRVHAMRVFTRVVDTNSFSRAAESLGLPRASVSTTIQQLEALVGVQLLARTTRRLNLTVDGAAYYERCARILADIDELESGFHTGEDRLRGRLRVEMPDTVATSVVVPALPDFHARYPHIDLSIGISNRAVDLVGEGVDCSVQLGELPDSGLIARRLGSFEHVTCASPAYLEEHGTPATLDDLAGHVAVNCVSDRTGRPVDFDFEVNGKTVTVKMPGFVQVTNEHAYLACGVQGLGLIQPPRIAALPYLRSGQLREVLPQWKSMPMKVSVAFLKTRQATPRVSVFVDWLADLFERSQQMEDALTKLYGAARRPLGAAPRAPRASRASDARGENEEAQTADEG
ncbi:Probable transcription regulator protein of MDR efflux pump cluster [Caballeronia glathei]|uniref:LysR family transcriptional regulator n=1 Tax=Caballeronia glathei TaxID=60547 RepID=A0A069PEV2_9BURK|nr:LysR family transcriptional regulator [Caballeronia glathei]KDR39052.1 LysR family transcriptional regulator [Caballeronia glathei]CDY74728.1 Probable transcription regulator protein of MDR efflux pump cluster [Caballeronia glathei]